MKSYFQRLTVEDFDGTELVSVRETHPDARDYWSPVYPYNDFTNEFYGPLFAYNPRIGAKIWEADWVVPLLPDDGVTTLRPGSYKVTYAGMLTHRLADPMFPYRGAPGGDGYPPIGGPWGFEDNGGELWFDVE
jgi:hypothetical protein